MFTSFAKRQLEKCGWSEGEGIGKNKQGIVKPLKASLKFSNSGLGYDITESYSTGWWVDMFNASAKNIKTDATSKVKCLNKEAVSPLPHLTEAAHISRKFSLNKSDHLQLHKYSSFIKCETLHGADDSRKDDGDDGQMQARNRKKKKRDVVEDGMQDVPEVEDKKRKRKKIKLEVENEKELLPDATLVNGEDVVVVVKKSKKKRCRMEQTNIDNEEQGESSVSTKPCPQSLPTHSTDTHLVDTTSRSSSSMSISHHNSKSILDHDALFKACGGLTCHKAARHGLGLNGKLARIAQQDADLLLLMKTS